MTSIHHPDLLEEIDTFIAETGMGEKYFGKKAVGNSEVVPRLRNGGRVWPETERAIRDFINSSPSLAPDAGAGSEDLPAQKDVGTAFEKDKGAA